MKVVKPPEWFLKNRYFIFLAGSIEMGKAENWQNEAIKLIKEKEDEFRKELEIIVFNPRRDDWDSQWIQAKENVKFREQVKWEHKALEVADFIILYFDPKTKSPISLQEQGLYARSGKLVVICPEGYWRKGNVDILCEKYNIPQFMSILEVIQYIFQEINTKKEKIII